MKKHKPQLYRSPIDLPTARSGKIEIKHRIIEGEVMVIGARQAYLRNLRCTVVNLTQPLRVHELHDEEHGLWMTDLPEELNQIGEMIETLQPYGNVLVGGLGLGIVATTLAQRKGVLSVMVVERNKDIIHLCSRAGQFKYCVMLADIKEFLKHNQNPFDFYLLDTWQGTGEGMWWDEVMPLRRLIRQRWGTHPVVHCWAEDIMWGQVKKTLMDGRLNHWKHKELPTNMTDAQAEKFFRDIGLSAWEKKYNWYTRKEK